MKFLRSIMTASAMILAVASAFAQENADMSVFKTVGGNAAKIAKLAADAGISEQELSENDVVILKSKKPMYVAKVGQGVDYTGTIWCEGSYLPNIYYNDATGENGCRRKVHPSGKIRYRRLYIRKGL